MALKLITPPAETPVSLAEMKQHLRVDHTDHDAMITALIQAATEHLDGWTGILGRALVSQTWELIYDRFPSEGFRIPLAPVSAVESVKYDDPEGVEQTVDAADYYVDLVSPDAWVVLVSGGSWPTPIDAVNTVRARFVVGYGAAAAVPEALKSAIKLHVQRLYEPLSEAEQTQNVNATDALTAPYRRWLVA